MNRIGVIYPVIAPLVLILIVIAFGMCRQFSSHKRTIRLRRVECPLRTNGITPLRTVEKFMSLSCKHGNRADDGNDAVPVKRAYGLRSKQYWDEE